MRKTSAIAAFAALTVVLVCSAASAQDRQGSVALNVDHQHQQGATGTVEPITTRVIVSNGRQATGVVNGSAVDLNNNEDLSVVWHSRNFTCNGGVPGGATFTASGTLTCKPITSGVMAGQVAVRAKLEGPVNAGSYNFGVAGCPSCTRNLAVTRSDYLTTDTGYTRPEVDSMVEESGNGGDSCCEANIGYALAPDSDDATSAMGHGFGLAFLVRPLRLLEVGASYRYSAQDVWLNQYLRDDYTDDDHTEHTHAIMGRVLFSYPVVEGDHDWLRLGIGGLIGSTIWHYEEFHYDQLNNGRLVFQNNSTDVTFDLGLTAGVLFAFHEHIGLRVDYDGQTNVNGHNRTRANTNAGEREEPVNQDGHAWRNVVMFKGAFIW